MISIGLPERLQLLIRHLEISNGEEYLFVDPDNILYDELDLNRGVQRTFFNINMAYAFLERFTKKNGTKELLEILPKWNKAFYIPPKIDQALLQGGTFVFSGRDTIYAHYDPSTAAHASIDYVMELVKSNLVLDRAPEVAKELVVVEECSNGCSQIDASGL